ncbi:MAG: hypothetical protein O3B45_08960 [Bacteroidetes bacterium]|nr:hypothetical protein [Bacteroidota bacterium]
MLLALLIGGMITAVATANNDHDHKVLINHKGKVISVSESALDAHLDHGDEIIDDGAGDDCGGCDPV